MLRRIDVRARPGNRSQGILVAGPHSIVVALGRSGMRANKFEGDGATPVGTYRALRLFWRADRMTRPAARLPMRPIGPADAWCEDPADRRYNRPFRRKPGEAGDLLRRADALYDLVIEISHNVRPRISRRGSAVFIHVARPGLTPTQGCVALPAAALTRLLSRLGPRTSIVIHR